MLPTPEFIEQVWPLSEVKISEILKQNDRGRTLVKIETREGSFIYRIPDESKTKQNLDEELLIFDFLPRHGFSSVANLLKTRDGNLYQKTENHYAYVLEYIEGTHPEPSVDTYQRLGQLVGKLHTITGYPHDSKFDADLITRDHLPNRDIQDSVKAEYLELIKKLPDFNHLPKALIHTDIGPNNSIQRPEGEILIIDWDDIGNGPAILDIGFPLIQQLVTDECVFLEKEARAFYDAYFSVRTISTEERKYIFDAALFVALDYIIYGASQEKRLKRIQWALSNKALLESVYQ